MGGSPANARKDRTSSGYARYVGRVGGLAFALGVGAAVVTGAAVASADTSDSGGSDSTSASASASSSSSSSTSATSSSSASSSASASDDSTSRSAGPSKTRSGKASQTKADSDDSESDGADGSGSGSTKTGSDNESDAASDADADSDADDTGDADAAARDDDDDAAPAVQESTTPTTGTQALAAAEPDEPSFFEKLFSNQSPTLNHVPTENTVIEGRVVGNLHAEDADSTRLTYTATRPTHGTVVVAADGTFVYTPGTTYAGQDSFNVTVSDARDGFHIHGGAGLLSLFSFGLLGNSGHRATETVFIGQERATVVSGLNSPVDFRFLPDGRILVAEKGGAIRVVQNGTLLAQPAITVAVRTEVERGISGLAIDPQFASNGRIYVSYIASATTRNTLSRFTMTGNTATFDKVLLQSTLDAAPNHHGGALGFGTDGKLYWGVGDNATGSNAQNLANIHGKILRLNSDGSVPTDNPLINGSRSAIYAYGLRNPFRLTFTPTGELLVADVGNAAFEEVNKILPGRNYGWPSSEGLCTSSCSGKTDPIYTYARSGGAAITSVTVFMDKVFIADTVKGWIKVLTCTPDYTSCGDVQTYDPAAGSTVVLSTGPDGALYQLKYSPGELIRLIPAAGSGARSL